MVDRERYDRLMRKRQEVGLSDAEANELGRMMAEMAGRPYSNAQTKKAGDVDADLLTDPTTTEGEDRAGS